MLGLLSDRESLVCSAWAMRTTHAMQPVVTRLTTPMSMPVAIARRLVQSRSAGGCRTRRSRSTSARTVVGERRG